MAAPSTGPIDMGIHVSPTTSFSQAVSAISNKLFSLGASGTSFSISAKLKRPELFTRSLLCGQSFIVITNIAVSCIMYSKIGRFLASPALGSACPLIKKISYGIVLPGLVVTAVIWSHISAKYWFVRILRGTSHLQANTVIHWTVWVGSMVVTVVSGSIIVGVVPFFDNFLSLVGALVNPIFTNIFPGFMILFFLAHQSNRNNSTYADGGVDTGEKVDTKRFQVMSKWVEGIRGARWCMLYDSQRPSSLLEALIQRS